MPMVSYIESPNQPPPHRPPSVTSRASTSRRHRSSRSFHGAAAPAAQQNEFPIFSQTGEVEIIVASINGRKEQRYLLHRLILSQCSGFFEADIKHDGEPIPSQLLPESSYGALARIGERDMSRTSIDTTASHHHAPTTLASERGGRGRWRYVLDWGNTHETHVPMLVQRDPYTPYSHDGAGPPPVSRNKPPVSSSSFFRSMSNFSALTLDSQPSSPPGPDDELLRDYDNLFRIFYNYPPNLDSMNIATAYTESKALLHLADSYDALDVVGPRIDHHMLHFQGRLFKQIAKYPASYLKLAYLAKSRVIFAEALIHVVGQWPLAAPQLRGQVDLVVMDLIEDKIDEVEEVMARVEVKLFRLTLTTSRGERVSPSNSYLDWLVMSLFRQWVAENTTPAPVSILKDTTRPGSGQTASMPGGRVSSSSSNRVPSSSSRTGDRGTSQAVMTTRPPVSPSAQPSTTGRVYRLLGSTNNDAYLPHDEIKRFLKLTPEMYTRDNLRRFERRLDELKNQARDLVKPLTRNCLELDLASIGGAASLGYLTCARILDSDFPWDEN